MSDELKDILEKSNTLVKSQKLENKPLERVLYESNNLLTRLNKSSSTTKDYKGESLLVQEGFSVNNYINSLREINVKRLRQITEEHSQLPLHEYLEKEESFLITSCIEEVHGLISDAFYGKLNAIIRKTWDKEKQKKPTSSVQKEYPNINLNMVKFYSSIVLEYLRTKNSQSKKQEISFQFDKYLATKERNEIVETFKFLMNKTGVCSYLEDQYNRHVVSKLNKVQIYVETVSRNSLKKVTSYLKMIFRRKFDENDSDEKWRILYYMLRIGEPDIDYVRKNFGNMAEDIIHSSTLTINEQQRARIYQQLKIMKSFFEKLCHVLIYKLENVTIDFSQFKIEDYVWFKLKLGTKKKTLRQQIISRGPEHFNKNKFLYFKLLLLCDGFKQGLDFFIKEFPDQLLPYVHFAIALFYTKKNIAKEDYLEILTDYINFLKKENLIIDASMYCLLLDDADKEKRNNKLEKIITSNLKKMSLDELDSYFSVLSSLLTREDIQVVFEKAESKLKRNGEVDKLVFFLFFMFDYYCKKEITVAKKMEILLKTVDKLNLLYYNSIVSREFDSHDKITKYQDKFLNVIREQQLTLNFVNLDKYSSFLILMKLYGYFSTLDQIGNNGAIREDENTIIKNLELLPFTYSEINVHVHLFLKAEQKIKDVLIELLKRAFKTVKKREEEYEVLLVYVSKLQDYLPSHFFDFLL